MGSSVALMFYNFGGAFLTFTSFQFEVGLEAGNEERQGSTNRDLASGGRQRFLQFWAISRR